MRVTSSQDRAPLAGDKPQARHKSAAHLHTHTAFDDTGDAFERPEKARHSVRVSLFVLAALASGAFAFGLLRELFL